MNAQRALVTQKRRRKSHFLDFVISFLDAPSISIRGCDHPSVGPSICPSVRRSVQNAFSQTRARRILCRVFGLVKGVGSFWDDSVIEIVVI